MKLEKTVISDIKVPAGQSDAEVFNKAKRQLKSCGAVGHIQNLRIHKKSVDARDKRNINIVCSVFCDAEIRDAANLPANIKIRADETVSFPEVRVKPDAAPVIIGFGPAGMFAGLVLARAGLEPVIYERGGSIAERESAVAEFACRGILNEECNIQFGAGGAGTFSDGKLTTRIGDGRCSYVLETLHEHGAPDDILWKAKPHIGTDVLKTIVESFDKEIRRLGGDIRYNTKVSGISYRTFEAGGMTHQYETLVVASGHSARNLYTELAESGFQLTAKPFSAGVRIEHLQSDIDRAMYGDESLAEILGHAEYALSLRQGERGVYTFCMCPGGEVVAGASEAVGVVTNGMSRRARDGKNANSAVAVSVLPDDFGGTVGGAIEFQRRLERAAYAAGGGTYAAPMQTVGDFLSGKCGTAPSRIMPTYMGGNVRTAELHDILPAFIGSMLERGLHDFGRKLRGFDTPDAILTGLETRTSAPVRILRDETLCALGFDGVYPCGEGAGYAGGIISAAVDGIRIAEAILERYSK